MPSPLAPFRRARRQLRADLDEDPYLRYVLALALLLAGFGFWQRIPNFSTWDARDRLLDPLAVYGHVIADPGIESVREGVSWSREPFGATGYVYGLAILPVVLAAALLGQLDAIAAIPFYESEWAFWAVWQETPRWVWTWSIALARLVNVAFAVGCVYVTYRLGVVVGDRSVGRLAAVLLALTFGMLQLAHEVGEDVPALFVVLLALLLLVEYVQSPEPRRFYEASAVGGLALAFKLTAAPLVVVVGLAFLLAAYRETDWPRSLYRPRLLVAGAAVGAIAMGVGFPSAVVGRFDLLYARIFGHVQYRVGAQIGPDAPMWWWVLRGYLHAFGLPLFLAVVGGTVASVRHLRRRPDNWASLALVAAPVGLYLVLYGTWEGIRVHHLLPTIPLLVLLLASALVRLREHRPAVARPLVAVVLVTAAVYAGVGSAQYASMPRDQASDWIRENVGENETMETYRRAFDGAAVTHSLNVSHPHGNGSGVACPDYVQLTYADLLYLQDVPRSQRSSYANTNVSSRAASVRRLVDGETNYELVAEFGRRPPGFVPQRPTPGSVTDILRLGLRPHSDQYGDEQDLGVNQYTAIFERTGPCPENRSDPW